LLNLPKLDYAELLQQFNRTSERDLLIAIGRGEISAAQIRNFLLSAQ